MGKIGADTAVIVFAYAVAVHRGGRKEWPRPPGNSGDEASSCLRTPPTILASGFFFLVVISRYVLRELS